MQFDRNVVELMTPLKTLLPICEVVLIFVSAQVSKKLRESTSVLDCAHAGVIVLMLV